MKFILKNFIKKIIVSETPYKKNMRTAPEFLIAHERNFEKEKTTLINNIQKTQQLALGTLMVRYCFRFTFKQYFN
jgi:hypothetical protein